MDDRDDLANLHGDQKILEFATRRFCRSLPKPPPLAVGAIRYYEAQYQIWNGSRFISVPQVPPQVPPQPRSVPKLPPEMPLGTVQFRDGQFTVWDGVKFIFIDTPRLDTPRLDIPRPKTPEPEIEKGSLRYGAGILQVWDGSGFVPVKDDTVTRLSREVIQLVENIAATKQQFTQEFDLHTDRLESLRSDVQQWPERLENTITELTGWKKHLEEDHAHRLTAAREQIDYVAEKLGRELTQKDDYIQGQEDRLRSYLEGEVARFMSESDRRYEGERIQLTKTIAELRDQQIDKSLLAQQDYDQEILMISQTDREVIRVDEEHHMTQDLLEAVTNEQTNFHAHVTKVADRQVRTHQHFEERLDETTRKVQEVDQKVDATTHRIDTAVSDAHQKIDKTARRVEDHTTAITELRNLDARNSDALDALTFLHEETGVRIEIVEKESDIRHQQIKDLGRQLDGLDRDVSLTHTNLAVVNEMQQNIMDNSQSLRTLEKKWERLDHDLQDTQRQKEEDLQTVYTRHQRLHQLSSEMICQQDHLENMQDQLRSGQSDLETEIISARTSLSRLSQELRELSGRCTDTPMTSQIMYDSTANRLYYLGERGNLIVIATEEEVIRLRKTLADLIEKTRSILTREDSDIVDLRGKIQEIVQKRKDLRQEYGVESPDYSDEGSEQNLEVRHE